MNIDDLKLQLFKEEAEANFILEKVKNIQRDYDKKLQAVNKLKEEIAGLAEVKISISDHALIRYMERVCDIDLDAMRKTITEDEELLRNIKKFHGEGKFMLNDYTLVVKDYNIVTLMNVGAKK